MYHTLEFAVEFMVDLEVARNQPLERMLIKRTARRSVAFALSGSPSWIERC